jgi:hypothetical protein
VDMRHFVIVKLKNCVLVLVTHCEERSLVHVDNKMKKKTNVKVPQDNNAMDKSDRRQRRVFPRIFPSDYFFIYPILLHSAFWSGVYILFLKKNQLGKRPKKMSVFLKE